MDLQLKSKVAFVSGSTQGIGFAIAKGLLQEGATVIINGRIQEKVTAAIARLQQELPGAPVSGIAADFAHADQVTALLDKLPAIDILVNNVGVFELNDFFDIRDEEWTRFFEINVLSGIRLSRALLPGMLTRNQGRIIFISSEAGVNIPGNMIHYGMTKTAMLAVSRGLAQLTKNTAVTVNTILGGPTYSDGVATVVEQMAGAQQQPVADIKNNLMTTMNPTSLLQRFIEPEELAHLAVYLASPLSGATNGAALRADGGVLNSIL
ncbi:SDR family NAD(P)-dependent oxidoreductase [Chitinophaga nivalis]|uniref:SDR family oxidoreductase n=1 Tax=Chitinophaga nivalis TaxID=2991709 RepID=A0ABT3IKI8_9BACT|nr:SDR family oxidoreductase [Chitinophaga nivalis]MCW3465878.1 SDR family oxidoreductase [Chitinophaga nivalis]MCW3484431.1 SDR family oxidoreductase [Chitinophaga nivalis]